MLREKWHFGWDLWLFCLLYTWRTFFFYDDDDDAHHFLHNLWVILASDSFCIFRLIPIVFSSSFVHLCVFLSRISFFHIPNKWLIFDCTLTFKSWYKKKKSNGIICFHLQLFYRSSRFCFQQILTRISVPKNDVL